MRRGTVLVIIVIAAVLLPMWFVASQGEPPSEEIAIDQSVNEIRPLDGFVDTPNKLSPSQVGVIVWVALFVLLGVLAFF
jgi:flagellar basal body-associated protein FliL